MSTSLLRLFGNFLHPEDVARLCVPDVLDRIEALNDEPPTAQDVLGFVHAFVQSDPDLTGAERIMVKLQAKSLLKDLEKNGLQWFEVITAVRHLDTSKGILLGNGETARERRLNSRMDWLEQSENPDDWQFELKTLRRPVHSWGGYRCKGEVSEALAVHLDDGVSMPACLVPTALSLLEDKSLKREQRRAHALAKFDSYFRPEIDPLCTILAMATGLFKPEVTRREVEQVLVPSIITTWL